MQITLTATCKWIGGDQPYDFNQPQDFKFTSASFETEEQAQAFADQFPKGVKAKAIGCTRPVDGDYANGSFVDYSVSISGDLLPTKGNAINEAGIKRFRKTLQVCEKLGIEVRYEDLCANSYGSLKAFQAAITNQEGK